MFFILIHLLILCDFGEGTNFKAHQNTKQNSRASYRLLMRKPYQLSSGESTYSAVKRAVLNEVNSKNG